MAGRARKLNRLIWLRSTRNAHLKLDGFIGSRCIPLSKNASVEAIFFPLVILIILSDEMNEKWILFFKFMFNVVRFVSVIYLIRGGYSGWALTSILILWHHAMSSCYRNSVQCCLIIVLVKDNAYYYYYCAWFEWLSLFDFIFNIIFKNFWALNEISSSLMMSLIFRY